MTPLTGDIVECDCCQKTYKYFVWSFGSTTLLCRGCVRKRPSAYLDGIDAVDLDAEQDVIHDEIEELNPVTRVSAIKPQKIEETQRNSKRKEDKAWQEMKKKTVKAYRKNH
jgi:hypothetical protein